MVEFLGPMWFLLLWQLVPPHISMNSADTEPSSPFKNKYSFPGTFTSSFVDWIKLFIMPIKGAG